jgi:hypothetical protein
MITPCHESTTSLEQSIDFCACIHAQRMRTLWTNRAVGGRSVDGGDNQQTPCGSGVPWKRIASRHKSPNLGPFWLNRDAFSGPTSY